MTHKVRGMDVEKYAYYVNKRRQKVGLETWIWRQIVTSQTAHIKHKWPPYVTEWNPPHEKFLRTPLFICSATMLTSKLITEIIGNHSQFYVCANSCSKFVSSRSWQIMKLHMKPVMQGHLCPCCPPFNGQGGGAPVMHPRSGVPGYVRHGSCHGRHFDGDAKIAWQKSKFVTCSFFNLYFAPNTRYND